MRRNVGSELSTDKGKFSDNQERLLENNEYNRRVNDSYKKSKIDSDYFDAVNRGDMKAAQKAVEDAAKAAGYDKKMFHETNAENIHIFDISRGTHGGTDSETPYGIFTKTTDKNIGLGNKQMALYVKANRTLYVADRSEVKSKISELIDYYDEIAKIDKEYDALANKLEDAEFDALGEWMDEHPDADMDKVYPTSYIAHDMPADIDSQKYLDAFNKRKQNSEEWKNVYNKVAVKCKEIITDYLKSNNYDSMYFQIDGGSRGRQTDSLILLDPEQVKSAETITYDDNGDIIPPSERFNNAKKDIRYSHKASSNTDRVTITKGALAKLKANYEGEKVFNKKDISAALNNIEALNVLSKSERYSLASKLFEGYNIRLDSEHYEQFSEIMYNKIRARILQESDFELSAEETSIMDEQIVKALNDIVASGKESTRAKLEYSVSGEGLKKQADYWRSEYNRASEQIKIRGRILSIAHKIKELKTGAYVNAAQYKSDTFKHTIEQLGRIEFRGNMNNTGTRAIIKNLNEWYDDKNNSLYKGVDANTGTVGRFNSEIKQMMSAIADGDGAFTTEELLTIEKILSYFVGEIQDYNTILRNGKRVDAKPIAERHIKTAEEAQALKIKCGAIRAISRSPFAVMVADPATLMRQADGYMNGFFTEMFDEMRQGEIKAAVAEMEMTNEYRGFWKNNKAYAKRYNKDTVKVNGVDIPLRHAISLYMTYQRKQAQAGLVYSGFDILDGDKKITVYKGTDQKLDEKQIADISKKRADELKAQFNEKDLELVSVMERAFEECRKLKIEVDMALQHYTNVDKSGYYFPIRRSQIAQNIDMFSIFEGDRVSNLSMNKDLVKGAKNALLIEPVDIVFMRHIKATSLYSGLGVFTDNFNRLYNLNVNETSEELALGGEHSNYNRPKTIKSTLESDKFTKTMAEYFTELKKDIEGISTKEQSTKFFNDAVGYIRSAYAKYQLGANPKVWFTQLSSFFAATNILDHSSIIKGLGVKNKAA